MTWQDWCTIISTIISIAGLVLSIVTIVIAGGIKRAVINEKTLNRYRVRYQPILNNIQQLIGELGKDSHLNNYRLQNFGMIVQELDSFCRQWSMQDRKIIKSAKALYNNLYLKHKKATSHDLNLIVDFLTKFSIILAKEEYH